MNRRPPPHRTKSQVPLAVRLAYTRDAISAAFRGEPPIPTPRLMLRSGPRSFVRTGKRLASLLIEVAELRPDERVLDVGCGPGRVARVLAGYLSRGSYEGFDVMPEAVDWCRRTINRRHPNFRFTHVDLRNEMYNREGSIEPSSFVFPYPDADFDLVFLFSVFTHMLPADVERYLSEIARVLRPGGRSLMTFFLLNGESERAIRDGRAIRSFGVKGDGYRTDSDKVHERAVAYPEAWVRQRLLAAGLMLAEPVRYGSWSGQEASGAQDLILVERPEGRFRPGSEEGGS